eukprot:7984879-Alexandrium_andersonii.AAC.1
MRRRRTCARPRAMVGRAVAMLRAGAWSQLRWGEVTGVDLGWWLGGWDVRVWCCRLGVLSGGPLLARRGVSSWGGALPEAHPCAAGAAAEAA